MSTSTEPPVIQLTGLGRSYVLGGERVDALTGVNLTVNRGESLAIMGPSGSGKSTMLHLLGLLDRPSSGDYFFSGVDTSTLSDDKLAALRNRALGFVFQSFNLVAGESALDNVAAPLVYAGVKRKDRLVRAKEALDAVGLGNRMGHDPSQLSGGQRQRVAIARALVTRPSLLLADEPTGNLDSSSGSDVLGLLDQLHLAGLTTITITHDPVVAARCERTVRISDGRLVSDTAGVSAPPPPGTAVVQSNVHLLKASV